MEKEKITANMIFEMMGRPKEHIVETMNQLIEALGAEKGIKIKNKHTHEPRKIEQKDKEGKIMQTELFSTFSEVEIESEDLFSLLSIIFRFMPSHIEIIYPEKFELKNIELNSITNEIIARLHNYDSIVKGALMNNQILAKKLEALQNSSTNISAPEISYGDNRPGEEEHKSPSKKNKKSKKN